MYRFGNGGLLTSAECVTVPVVLADHPLLLSYSVVDTLCYPCSLEEMLLRVSVWTSRVAAKLWNTMVDQPLEDSVAGHNCVTLSPERYAGLLKLENSPDPPTSRLRPRQVASTSHITCPEEQQVKTCIDVGNVSLSQQQQHLLTAQA